MKKTFTILFALMVLCFTQCKPTPEGGDENGRKVKVSCTIPINNGGKSDFTNLMEDGKINWSTGTERVYLAIPNETSPQIVELTAFTTLQASELAFEGEVEEGLLEEGKEYEVWYLGNSKNLDVPYVTETKDGDLITKVSGSISEQSGELEDLGLYHIAKVSVTAVEEEGEIVLPLRGVLKSQIAIAYLDLEGVEELSGSAVKGTEYSLQYNGSTNKYDFVVTENPSSTISVTSGTATSFIVLLPNESNNVILKSSKGGYEFKKGVEGNKFYYRYISNVEKGTLRWAEIEEETNEINGHEYVDLGLPSGLLWATCNVGAETPEGYGDYFAWGETTTKSTYYDSNNVTYGLNDSSLQTQGYIDNNGNLTAQYDAATANWGGDWRMPTYDEMKELKNNCTWTVTTQNGVNGCNVEGPNGKSIFLPAAGRRDGSSFINAGSYGSYWCSTSGGYSYGGYRAYQFSTSQNVSLNFRRCGNSVRPVCGGNNVEPVLATVLTNDVTDITSSSAVCSGDVTTDNSSAVTARGVCWSTTQNPTIEDNKTTDGTGVGIFTSTLSDLLPQTTYYVRAYATNAAGTSYGEQESFTTLPAVPNANDHAYVDLGLSVKWATCNVGAETPEGYGDYFAWGETTTKTDYSSSTSATYGLSYSSLQSQGYIDNNGNLTAQHDAATANWGGDWRMPTYDELVELKNNCTWTWTTQNGVNGCKLTSKINGNYIFLPAAGYRFGSTSYIYSSANVGTYWSSTLDGGDYQFACDLSCTSSSLMTGTAGYRYYGQSIRPVID